ALTPAIPEADGFGAAATCDAADAHRALRVSPVETRADWAELAELRRESRARGVEGFMLKHRDARYGTGRRKQDDLAAGTWWKWKIDPLSVDCVLVYAQAGHGRRASVYTDRKSTRLNSSHDQISYAVFCLKKKKKKLNIKTKTDI